MVIVEFWLNHLPPTNTKFGAGFKIGEDFNLINTKQNKTRAQIFFLWTRTVEENSLGGAHTKQGGQNVENMVWTA